MMRGGEEREPVPAADSRSVSFRTGIRCAGAERPFRAVLPYRVGRSVPPAGSESPSQAPFAGGDLIAFAPGAALVPIGA